ncbi:DUF4253 domain-containing protein [Deinococcus pimensis]|uniref:DUF4253 domain-containing protein n=1 Tax=Deinococcus pimensis TaxID=309888 RepID=UPI0004B9FCCA|nr:DUF4253 domain-containing protein [Deinococcus pimensis]
MLPSLLVLDDARLAYRDVREVPFGDHSVLTFSVAGRDALSVWTRLAQAHPVTGCWPVVTGQDPFDPGGASDEPLREGEDARALLTGWLDGELEDPDAETYVGKVARTPEEARRYATTVPVDLPLPDVWEDAITSVRDLSTLVEHSRVYLALVETEHSWDAPAWLGFGGFNACPAPGEHTAVLRSWHDRYGLEVVSVTSDVLEFRVDRPPRDAPEALLLATEQFAYCSDIVYQGVETVPNLAGTLLRNPVWFFWWD